MVGAFAGVKLVVVGAGGRLGAALCRAYAAEHDVTGFSHRELDLGSRDAITTKIGPLEFDVLLNAAGLTNVDYCETHEEEATQINAHAVRQMAEICAENGARMIHFSTDYVFDGEKKTPYLESDEAKPVSIYGKSKLMGEWELLDVSPDNLVVRTSWVFGPDRPSFIDAILKRAMESDQVEAIADKFGAPSYTLDMADYLKPFLGGIRDAGVLHLCNAGSCSWRDYGQFAIDCAAAAGVLMKGKTVGALKLASMANFIAKRPVHSVLSTEKIARLTGVAPRPWQAAVEDYVVNYFVKKTNAGRAGL
jgi:dTDP-4-dehydrorhamnose reductase